MPQMITRSDIARLHLDLQAPGLLSSILDRDAPLAPQQDSMLRQCFTDLSPLETLISIACCFQVLIPYLGHDADLIEPINTQADYILDDYAPHWMKNAVPVTAEWAEFVRDDLENLADFLVIISDAAISFHPAASDICEILNEQAFLKSLTAAAPHAQSILETKAEELPSGNVIRFPVEKRF